METEKKKSKIDDKKRQEILKQHKVKQKSAEENKIIKKDEKESRQDT